MLLHPWTLPAGAALLFVAAPALAALPIQEHTCPDGLAVLVAEDHALPLVTIEIAAKNGSMTESPEYSGLSHLYEHLFFRCGAMVPHQVAYLARVRASCMLMAPTRLVSAGAAPQPRVAPRRAGRRGAS